MRAVTGTWTAAFWSCDVDKREHQVMEEPKTQKIKAIEVQPYFWGQWCTVDGSEPFVNTIVVKSWSRDGKKISFMLDSHNFMSVHPDEEMELVPLKPSTPPHFQESVQAFIEKRPKVVDLECAVNDAITAAIWDHLPEYAASDDGINDSILNAVDSVVPKLIKLIKDAK